MSSVPHEAYIKRDGEVLAHLTGPSRDKVEFAVLAWFHRHTSGSMDWALKHEGYSVIVQEKKA